ncbi:MAG TPA: hypothetical protein VFO26_16690 [Gaiella sp.]|uniref:hypothetical protein n=1 Tax=Gaiella sp. TaxID=2663207 RepID=UPI002D7FC538|nr:hypothetical protein [Gaiella sp.]HET9289192.1 hypothetical protein [Gaiella sp.]
MTVPRQAEEWSYLRAACAVVGLLVVAELAGWIIYGSVHHEPTALELTQKCLRREKLLSVESIGDDAIAVAARGGALATRVEGNGVHLAIAKSDDEAEEIAQAYLQTAGRNIDARLDVRGRVVYVWEAADGPSPTQRQTMYDCWYE